MSISLSTFQRNYRRDFPTEVPTKAAQGFIVTATINLIAGHACPVILLGGTLAATATIIEAITRPIIHTLFPDNPGIATYIQSLVPAIMVLSVATSAAPWIGISYQVTSILISFIAWFSLNEDFYKNKVGMVSIL